MICTDDEDKRSNIPNNKTCFRCGKWVDEKWRKRKINGKWREWDLKNYFCNACNFRKGRIMNDIEKIVTLSLWNIRAFSKVSSIDTRKEYVRKELEDVIDVSYEKLKKWGKIKIKKGDLYNKSTVEYPVADLFKIAFNELQEITIGLAKNIDRMYYLDVVDERPEIFKENISSVLRLIIYDKEAIKDEELNCVTIPDSRNDIFYYSEELRSLSIDISDKKAAYIFRPDEHIFSSPKYDNIIGDIIEDL